MKTQRESVRWRDLERCQGSQRQKETPAEERLKRVEGEREIVAACFALR